MIWESRGYKRALLATASKIERWHRAPNWTEGRIEAFEKEVFVAFFMIRKLIESGKIADRLASKKVRVRVHPATGKRVDRFSRLDFWELYQMVGARRESRSLVYVCNQVIHSFVFASMDNRRGGTDIVVSSDRRRRTEALRIGYRDFIDVLRRVGSNYPRVLHMTREGPQDDWSLKLR